MSETSSNKSTSNISHSNKKKPTFSTDYLPNLFHDSQKLVTAPNRTIFQKSAISETSVKESDKHESDDIASFVNNAGGGGSGGEGSGGGDNKGSGGGDNKGSGSGDNKGSGGATGGGICDSGVDYDNYNDLAPEAQMLKKLDMLRKLGELAQYGVKLSQNYNMSSDYFTMKYEYELHKNIRAKQNSVNWMSSLMLNCIYGVEILNDKYNPFDLKLKNWSEQINADINNYYDIFGEIYEKYNKPGKNMSPELKLILMVSGSALKFHLNNTLLSQPGKIELGNNGNGNNYNGNNNNNGNNYIQDPALLEKMRQQAISDRIRQETEKNNDILRQKAEKEHELAHKQVGDMLFLQQKKTEAELEQRKKMIEFEQMKQFMESQTQSPISHQQQPQHQQQPYQQQQPQHQQHPAPPQIQQTRDSTANMMHHNLLQSSSQNNNVDDIRRININSQLNLIRDRVEKIDTSKLVISDKNDNSVLSSTNTSSEQKVSSSRKNSKEGGSTYARRKNTKKTISFDT
jgi:hypothetical protein